jgi:magnesium transporter
LSEENAQSDAARQRAGALRIPTNSPPPRIRFMEFDTESLVEGEIDDPEELRPYAHTSQTTWLDIQGLGDEERLEAIGTVLEIHRLALADAVNIPQRAKAEQYPDHLVIIIRAPQMPFVSGSGVSQVCILVAEGYVVSFQERYFGFFGAVREQIRRPDSDLRSGGPSFLAYSLIDALVDCYYPVVDQLADELDALEVVILENPTPELVSQLHQIQRRITTLRRVARPHVEALHQLTRSESALIQDSVRVYLKDVEDHAQQVMGRLDALREITTDMMSAVLAALGHRQNEVMKVLTLVGSIFIPLTFIAGIYGMNFEHMPELSHVSGYPLALGAMAIVAIGMVTFFRIKGWIGGSKRR